MKKIAFTIFLIAMSTTAFSVEAAVNELAALDKSGDTALQKMINETVPNFRQLNYTEGGNDLPCNLFLPEDYPGIQKYPLVVFIADGSTVGGGTDTPLRQGYGGIVWASDAEQAKHKCIVLVPQYPQRLIDDRTGTTAAAYISMTENLIRAVIDGFQVNADRVYATGQSMGCMALMLITEKNPSLFAAELFVGGRREPKEIEGLRRQKFFHLVAEGDQEAASAQAGLVKRFQNAGIPISRTHEWDARMSQEEFASAIRIILSGQPVANFARFIKGTTLPAGTSAGVNEHLYSFDAAYKIDALRDWLFTQVRK